MIKNTGTKLGKVEGSACSTCRLSFYISVKEPLTIEGRKNMKRIKL